jgi:hypothetical protein
MSEKKVWFDTNVDIVPVDSGSILVADMEFFRMYGCRKPLKKLDEFTPRIKVEKGLYDMKWNIDETWNGDVKGSGSLLVTSGDVMVCDPCYLIRDDLWDVYLKNTYYGFLPHPGTVTLDKMGGDGTYEVFLRGTQRVGIDYLIDRLGNGVNPFSKHLVDGE